jgi:solute carrier family 35 protein E4
MDVVFYVGSWFLLNTFIGNITKTLYLRGFAYPLFLTVVHMVFSWGACGIYLEAFKAGKAPEEYAASRADRKRVRPTVILPLSASFAVSVGAGNLALQYIYPSFNQMLGCTTPLITLFLAIALEGTRYNAWSYLSVTVITVGVMLCCAGEVNFHVLGLTFNMLSNVLRGVKSIVQGQLLQGQKLDSVTLLYLMAPQTAAMLLPMSFLSEGAAPWLALVQTGTPVELWGLLTIAGMNACLLNLSQFVVTKCTSALTLQVLGSFKTIAGIIASLLWFRNEVTAPQVVGIIASVGGGSLYQQKGKKLPKPSAAPEVALKDLKDRGKAGSN